MHTLEDTGYFLPKKKIKDYNVVIDGPPFQSGSIILSGNIYIRKITIGKGMVSQLVIY